MTSDACMPKEKLPTPTRYRGIATDLALSQKKLISHSSMPNFGTKAKSKTSKSQQTRRRQRPSVSTTGSSSTTAATWVDRLCFVPVHHHLQKERQERLPESPEDSEATAVSGASGDCSHDESGCNSMAAASPTEASDQKRDQPAVTTEDDRKCSSIVPNRSRQQQLQPSLSIISWNILAESYCTPRSQANLPPSYRKVAFDPARRRRLVCNTLRQFLVVNDDETKKAESTTESASVESAAAHVICLQEVDLADIGTFLARHGYTGVETPRTKGGGAGGRCDACTCFVYSKEWSIVEHELVRLDDLATLMMVASKDGVVAATATANGESVVIAAASSSSSSNNNLLEGLQQSFLRRNVALLVRIRSKRHPYRTVVIATAHLYWHPGYEYVKLCQAHYVLLRARKFVRSDMDEPFVFCGDFNSRPHGAAYTYLTRGVINGKLVAPWYHQLPVGEAAFAQGNGCGSNSDNSDCSNDTGADDDEIETIADRMTRELSLCDNETSDSFQPKVRYMLDNTLNRLCRWLRILGQDAALETDAEERLRTREGIYCIFDRCNDERRTLVTTSRRILSRRDCPPGAYWLSPKLINNLELALVHMLLTHGVILEPSTFLSRCVVCNGYIVEIHDAGRKREILQSYDAPCDQMGDMEVYECNGCRQGYWWCDQPTSSASRVKNAATNMFQLCLRAGVQCSKDLGMFNYVDVEYEMTKGWDYTCPGSEMLQQKLQVVDWLKNERLACPIVLESAYKRQTTDGEIATDESIPFTNVTDTFVNVLDYIFHNKSIKTVSRLSIPTSFTELNPDKLPRGHVLPSNIWPSDHLAIGATFAFVDHE